MTTNYMVYKWKPSTFAIEDNFPAIYIRRKKSRVEFLASCLVYIYLLTNFSFFYVTTRLVL